MLETIREKVAAGVRLTPAEGEWMLTSAPLTTAPSASFTVPVILPFAFCAHTTAHTRMVHKRAVRGFIESSNLSPGPNYYQRS